jgi:hypothetical protein
MRWLEEMKPATLHLPLKNPWSMVMLNFEIRAAFLSAPRHAAVLFWAFLISAIVFASWGKSGATDIKWMASKVNWLFVPRELSDLKLERELRYMSSILDTIFITDFSQNIAEGVSSRHLFNMPFMKIASGCGARSRSNDLCVFRESTIEQQEKWIWRFSNLFGTSNKEAKVLGGSRASVSQIQQYPEIIAVWRDYYSGLTPICGKHGCTFAYYIILPNQPRLPYLNQCISGDQK